jgi:large subunit ribosomal protein L13
MIIDGKDAVLGRLASTTAKKLLKGEEIVIINAEKVIVTGRPNDIKQEYLKKRQIGSPQHGPFFPREPQKIVRRTIRGMLPYKTPKGRVAFKKLRVYVGENGMEGEPVAQKTIKSNFMTVRDVAKILGWREK